MNRTTYIENNDKILIGKPVVKGTRISVEHILNLLASGRTDNQIPENFPNTIVRILRLAGYADRYQ